ncbi:hypothetical protein E4U47_006087, partial [Claviceps purpurea]
YHVSGIIRQVEADDIVSLEDVPTGVKFIAEYMCDDFLEEEITSAQLENTTAPSDHNLIKSETIGESSKEILDAVTATLLQLCPLHCVAAQKVK